MLFIACKRPFDARRVASLVNRNQEALRRVVVFRPETLQELLECLKSIHDLSAELSAFIPPDARVSAVIIDDPYGYPEHSSEMYQDLATSIKNIASRFECPIIYSSRTKMKGSRRITGETLAELEDAHPTHTYFPFPEALLQTTTLPSQSREITLTINDKTRTTLQITTTSITFPSIK